MVEWAATRGCATWGVSRWMSVTMHCGHTVIRAEAGGFRCCCDTARWTDANSMTLHVCAAWSRGVPTFSSKASLAAAVPGACTVWSTPQIAPTLPCSRCSYVVHCQLIIQPRLVLFPAKPIWPMHQNAYPHAAQPYYVVDAVDARRAQRHCAQLLAVGRQHQLLGHGLAARQTG